MTTTEVETLYDIVSRGRVAFDGAGYYIRLEVNDRERLASGLMKIMQEKRANETPKQNAPQYIPDWIGRKISPEQERKIWIGQNPDYPIELDKPF